MKASPAFQLYPADFLVGVADMTNEEVGIYIRLLCLQWAKGQLDASKVARCVGTEIPPAVLEKFQVADGRMWNARLESVRVEQAKRREEQSKKGKAGADARWHSNGHAPANGRTMPRPSSGHSPNDGSSSSSSGFNLPPSEEAHGAAVAAARVAGSAQAVDPELLDWLRWWNTLKANSLVMAGVNEREPSRAIVQAWKRCKVDASLWERLRDRGAIEREIRASSFLRSAGWFRLEKLLGGQNRDGELYLTKLLESSYQDRKEPDDKAHASTGSKANSLNDYIARHGDSIERSGSTTLVAEERPRR